MPVLKDLLRLQTDFAVTAGEVAFSKMNRKRLLRQAPCGGGQPVLLLPGYMAGDESLASLCEFLNQAGFAAHTWGLGQNSGFEGEAGQAHVDAMAARIIERVREVSLAAGGRKVALVGQSLGGLYSRETAARYADEIDRVITLGSPTIHPYINDDQNSFIVKLASRKADKGARFSITGKQGFLHWGARHPALPCIAIWSPIDAVVFSQSARIPDYIVQTSQAPAIRENVRLVCSHSGMAFNEAVVLAVADRLVQPITQWTPFKAENYFPRWAIKLVEQAFGNRLFHEFMVSDWREADADRPQASGTTQADEPALLSRLRGDHRDFHQLYQMIEESLGNGELDEETDYLLLADVARFMTDYLDRRHHPLEEFVFEQLLNFHPAAKKQLAHLSAEHERIARQGGQLLEQVERASDPRRARQPGRLLARWQRFCETLRQHVELEEQILFPLAVQHMPEQAWDMVLRDWQLRSGDAGNPLSDAGAGEEFRHLFEYLSYVASKHRAPQGLGDNALLGRYLDSLVAVTERLDRVLERRS